MPSMKQVWEYPEDLDILTASRIQDQHSFQFRKAATAEAAKFEELYQI